MSGLIDVNVLLDVLLNRSPGAVDAREIWRANHAGRFKGHVASTRSQRLRRQSGARPSPAELNALLAQNG
jgi:hypothetical protein